ncbi:MAG: hypothetical protein A2157_19890 [Deltaproteobacteria bacterium RBG_16_47_11]|nr:MAG: hypothetical protein A2157_19890 [Deltaproteobacteria bacterium RBG_16_47_11]
MQEARWILPAVVLIFVFFAVSFEEVKGQEKPGIVVGSKGFTEQLILGNMVALLMENNGFKVDRKVGLGGTVICHEAIVRGDLNVYVEYTGAALTTILKREVIGDPEQTYQAVKKDYEEKFKLTWLKPLGFKEPFGIVIRKEDADRLKITKISDLKPYAKNFVIGISIEFPARNSVFRLLAKEYDLKFKDQKPMDFGLVYKAIAEKQVDVTMANSTDGQISAFNLVVLEDDPRFFGLRFVPTYYAAPVVRMDLLEKAPQVADILNPLGGKISEGTMTSLNYTVDGKKQVAEDVAQEFLKNRNFIK